MSIGKITQVDAVNNRCWSVVADLYEDGKVSESFKIEVLLTNDQMERIKEITRIGCGECVRGQNVYFETGGMKAPSFYVLAEIKGKCWSKNETDIIGKVREVSVVEHNCIVVIQHDEDDGSEEVRCTITAEEIMRIEWLLDGKDHSVLVGKKAFYFANDNKAYIAVQIK